MREESIRKTLKKEIEERQRKASERMREEYETGKERYIEGYVAVMDNLLKQCKSCRIPRQK